MNRITKISLANLKHYRSKNILTGIAIFLTTLLLFLVPTIGKNMIDGQFAVINEVYPRWHALYGNVSGETAERLAAHHVIGTSGLRSDAGLLVLEDAQAALLFLDEAGLALYNMELLEGHLPEQENEIVVSRGILAELGQTGEPGDRITLSYQVFRNGGLDFAQEREFIITGFLEDAGETAETRSYTAIVSKAFLESELPAKELTYRFLFQVGGQENGTTEAVEDQIYSVAEQFGIPEQQISINNDYLMANYVDPAIILGIAVIILIIVAAGMITIYSIYYVSMGERVQEFGRLKAIGATRRQIKQLVLREGFAVAGLAMPLGLIVGTVLSRMIFTLFVISYSEDELMLELFREHRFAGWHWWIYVLAVVVTLGTVYLSLLRPMKAAARVSEVEAMRYSAGNRGKKRRKGYRNVTIARLTGIYLAGNKKKSLLTICSMAATGLFFMVIATVLACATPRESADSFSFGQYVIKAWVEYDNKEHPEREWSSIQQNNPLTEEVRKAMEQVEGVRYVRVFSMIDAAIEEIGGVEGLFGMEGILGVPPECEEELLAGITEGTVSYEELCEGNKVIVDSGMLYWYPEIQIGDILHATLQDGEETREAELEVVAFSDYPGGFTNYNYLIMAKEGVDSLGQYNLNYSCHVFAEEDYNEEVEAKLRELMGDSELLSLSTWQAEYERWKLALSMTSVACYTFLGVLGMICIMNMINTMINGVHVRKKEIGMLQALGMSDRQLIKMLELEGLFYTLGTLVVSVGGGSLLGYPVFLWARKQGLFGIRNYHYPMETAILLCVVLLLIQLLLAWLLGRSVKKEALIERVRFSG